MKKRFLHKTKTLVFLSKTTSKKEIRAHKPKTLTEEESAIAETYIVAQTRIEKSETFIQKKNPRRETSAGFRKANSKKVRHDLL